MASRLRRADDDFSMASSQYSTRPMSASGRKRQSSVPRSRASRQSLSSRTSERFPLGCEPTREYGEQEYLKDQKMKLTYEIGQLVKDLKPLRKKLKEKEAQFLDKNELEQIYMQQIGDVSEVDQVIERRVRTAQVMQLHEECGNVMAQYEELRYLFSMPLLRQLAMEVSDGRQDLFHMRDACENRRQEIEEAKQRIKNMTMSNYHAKLLHQRHKIAQLKEKVRAKAEEYDKLREKNKRYVMEVHQIRQQCLRDRDSRRIRDNRQEISALEKTLREKQEILEATRSRYRLLRMKQESEQKAVSRAPATDYDDESFSDQIIQERVVAVGLFRRSVTENEVRRLFSQFGAIHGLRIFPKKGTRPQAYFAKIAFYDHDEAEQAIAEMNGVAFEGHLLNVKWAKDQSFLATLPPTPTVIAAEKHTQENAQPIRNVPILESESSDSSKDKSLTPPNENEKRVMAQKHGVFIEAVAIEPPSPPPPSIFQALSGNESMRNVPCTPAETPQPQSQISKRSDDSRRVSFVPNESTKRAEETGSSPEFAFRSADETSPTDSEQSRSSFSNEMASSSQYDF